MKSDIAKIIHDYGEPVEFTPRGGTTVYVTASVQSPVYDPLANDLDMGGFVVYFTPDDLAGPPKKFDKARIRGKDMSVDEDAAVEYLSGIPIAYATRVRG